MALGIVAASQGDLRRSLDYFDRVVRTAPDFAEGWNKRATVYYMMGDYTASVEDIRRTLALEPRHFGALSGMGLIYDAIGDTEAAVKVWEKALEIHPHMEGIRNRIRELRGRAKGNPT
jgi:tetratricopeptide (TPR) repeat protein